MTKLFISQPMRGLTEDEILAERAKAIWDAKAILRTNDVDVIDSFFGKTPPGKNIPLKYLAKSLYLLADADVAYFCEGWESARGCRLEYKAAMEYGIRVIEYVERD